MILNSRSESELVLESLQDIIDKYDVASVADLYQLVGLPTAYTDNKLGLGNSSRIKSDRCVRIFARFTTSRTVVEGDLQLSIISNVEELKKAYSGEKWTAKVDKMSDSQVTAIYIRLKAQGKLGGRRNSFLIQLLDLLLRQYFVAMGTHRIFYSVSVWLASLVGLYWPCRATLKLNSKLDDIQDGIDTVRR